MISPPHGPLRGRLHRLRRLPVRAGAAAAAALALLLASPGPAHAASGDLDPSFGGNGRVVTPDIIYAPEEGHGLAVQDDGKLVVVGSFYGEGTGPDFAMERYNPDGTPDTDFGNQGVVTTDFQQGEEVSRGLALQPDGKIVVVGISQRPGSEDCCWFTVARFESDGDLDTEFGDGGRTIADFGDGGAADAYAVTVQSDGRIVAVGQSGGDIAVARFDADGDPDPTFSGDGRLTTHFSGGDISIAQDVAVQPDDRIVVAGGVGLGNPGYRPAFALARYDTNGSLDTGFDGDGKRVVSFGGEAQGYGLVLIPGGDMAVAGYVTPSGGISRFALARLNSDGSLDTGFDGDGKATTPFAAAARAHDLALQSDGKLVAAGSRGGDWALTRYNTDGSLDTGFDGDGKVVTDFSVGVADHGRDVLVQPDGRIVVAGDAGSYLALARYLP
ncbi:delta-60 repeat domain-containing protein [Streptomyces sp. NPDC053367]|uniref:delta-60 repeat domain-containing protein n=1 Tax=Streptomyces sp. NPDC053367 TaxID=3365700 RepID=UPI0037D4BD98